ncbi:MAG: hypothetical protein IT569_09535, partial [Leptospiraceae bacterium]|nr:hypothetical protein [Leptospiraceae bacterium]
MENLKSLIYLFLAFFIIVIIAMAVVRRPLTSAKITFGIFGGFLCLWNINESLFLICNSYEQYFQISKDVLEICTFFFLALFSLNFPFYRRRDSI